MIRSASSATTLKTGPAAEPPNPALPLVPFSVTTITSSGFCIGMKPMNEALYVCGMMPAFKIEYLGSSGLTRHAVARNFNSISGRAPQYHALHDRAHRYGGLGLDDALAGHHGFRYIPAF